MGTLFSILEEKREQTFFERIAKKLGEMDIVANEISELRVRVDLLEPQGLRGRGKDFDYYISLKEELDTLKEIYKSYPLGLRIFRSMSASLKY